MDSDIRTIQKAAALFEPVSICFIEKYSLSEADMLKQRSEEEKAFFMEIENTLAKNITAAGEKAEIGRAHV